MLRLEFNRNNPKCYGTAGATRGGGIADLSDAPKAGGFFPAGATFVFSVVSRLSRGIRRRHS